MDRKIPIQTALSIRVPPTTHVTRFTTDKEEIVARYPGEVSIVQKHSALVAFTLLLLATVSCGKDNPIRAEPPLLGTFVFYGYERGTGTTPHLYVVNADGSGFHRLTADSVAASEPR